MSMDKLTLTMFDGGAGAGAGGAGAAGAGAASGEGAGVAQGAPAATGNETVGGENKPEQTEVQKPEDLDAEFEQLIKGKFKAQHTKRTQQIIDQRFKQSKGVEERLSKLEPALQLLAERYGVDPSDTAKLADALQNDDSFYEESALQEGMTVEQYKQNRRMARELEQYKKAETERQQKERMNAIISKQLADSEQVAKVYPGFNLMNEIDTNPEFAKLIHPDNPYAFDVKTAYEIAHRGELMSGAIQYAAQQVQKRTVDDIIARGARPPENGLGGQPAIQTGKIDIRNTTREEREKLYERARRGERITLK